MRIPKSTIQLLVGLEVLVLLLVIVLSIFFPIKRVLTFTEEEYLVEHDNIEQEVINDNIETTTEETEPIPQPIQKPIFSEEILEKVENMTIEEKVAQVFLTTPEELTGIENVSVTGQTSKDALQMYPVAGLVYSEKNFLGKQQTKALVTGIQQYSTQELGTPLFLAVKEQGGTLGSPLATKNGYPIGLSPSELGNEADELVAKEQAKAIGGYLSEEGFNLNFGLNADLKGGVDALYDNTTFSGDKEVCSKLLSSVVQGYQENAILAVMGTFPGKNKGLNLVQDKNSWETNQKSVYQAGIDANVMGVIVGNGTADFLTEKENLPCCFSTKVVEYLRANMAYKNLIISDDLSEKHIKERYTPKESAVAAMNAGMDVLYYSSDFKQAYEGLLEAVRTGQVLEERLDEAVARILTSKIVLDL